MHRVLDGSGPVSPQREGTVSSGDAALRQISLNVCFCCCSTMELIAETACD